MKTNAKIIIVSIIAICLLIGFTSCGFVTSQSLDLGTLNDMLAMKYSTISLVVNVEKDGNTLKSTFNTIFNGDKQSVTYSIQQFGEFEVVDGEVVPPKSYIVTKSGTLYLENGVVTDKNGDDVDVDLTSIDVTRFSFVNSYFTSASKTSTSFKANVTNVKGFMSNDNLTATNMVVNAQFLTKFVSITITYKSADGANVTLTYSFS